LDAQITRIEQLHAQSLLTTTTTQSESHVELDSLVASTSSLINSIKNSLEKLGNDAKKGGDDARKKVDLVNAQRRKLQERVRRFQNVEKLYRDKLRDRAIRQYRVGISLFHSKGLNCIVNPDISEAEISQALVDPNSQIFQQALLSSTRSSQARSTLSEVQSRHNEIISIERKIVELSQMFTELNVMISLQDDQIEPIVAQADNTRQTISQGLEQVSRATKLARAVRRKKWWCIFIIFLIIAIIVVVVAVTQTVNKKT
jgi:syntaxin 1B/2/3